MRERIPAAQLRFLEESIWEEFRKGTDIELTDEKIRHAVLLLRNAEYNRRGFRRWLRAFAQGSRSYVEEHEETKRWYRQHPRLKANVWRDGLVREVRIGESRVTLALEKNPLEVLKLGTYVGSCLGLGGMFSETAITALLDANKQVVFARDANGAFLARQLVCLSDDDRLVPFKVYGASEARRTALEAAFLEYDRAFAEELGLPLGPEKDGSPIALILADKWWEDGPWDLNNA